MVGTRRVLQTLWIVLVCAGALAMSAPECLSPAHAPSPSDGAIAVRARSSASLRALEVWAKGSGYDVRQRDDALRALVLIPREARNTARTISALESRPGVEFAEPLARFESADVPADPLYDRQQTYLRAANAETAWDIETGRADVIVAVLDTGVQAEHPDLRGRIWRNAGEAANGRDDDGNGCIDDVQGCAFVELPHNGCAEASGGKVADDIGHGTFVAGIIAANANNVGIAGVAPGVTIMPVKVLDCEGGGTSFGLAQGILYAANNGARVINISLGGDVDSSLVREAVRYATQERGVLIVAASGNCADCEVAYPARYPEVLAVGGASVDNPSVPASFATGGTEVDVAAVAEGIVGTVPASSCDDFLPCLREGPYAVGDGTSFAAPQVAGLAALLVSHRPALGPAALQEIIKATARRVTQAARPWAGAGRIDMAAALTPAFRLGTPGIVASD